MKNTTSKKQKWKFQMLKKLFSKMEAWMTENFQNALIYSVSK